MTGVEWTCPNIFYSHSWPDWAKYSSLESENVAGQRSMRSNQGWAGLGWAGLAGLGWAVFVWADYTSLSPAGGAQLVVAVPAPAGHTFLGQGDTRARGLTTTSMWGL